MTQQKLSRYMVDTRTKKIAACNITIDLTTRLECTYGFGDVWEVLGVAKSFADPVISKVFNKCDNLHYGNELI